MGWAVGYDNNHKRDIGYGVPAICDHPDCNEKIDRGLSYVCGSEPYGGENGCGLFFCSRHRFMNMHINYELCEQCCRRLPHFQPKPDLREWVEWKLKDDSWGQWREENPDEVGKIKRYLEIYGDK